MVPSATEIIFALGAGDEVVGVTYACDWPPEARARRVIVKPRFTTEGLLPVEIDMMMSQAYGRGESLYVVDADALSELRPDLIVAQELCEVCAAAPGSVEEAVRSLRYGVEVVTLHPHTIGDIFSDILLLGDALGRQAEARLLVEEMSRTINEVQEASKRLPRQRTFFMEWIFPPYCSGHWVPEMVELAGGIDLGVKARPSRRVLPEEVVRFEPEVIITGPCGYNLEQASREASALLAEAWIRETLAFRRGMVYAVDASRYFSRHGTGIAAGVEILAEIIHPEVFKGRAPGNTYRRITPP
jgi:iron complex transport system substrate-binding protein